MVERGRCGQMRGSGYVAWAGLPVSLRRPRDAHLDSTGQDFSGTPETISKLSAGNVSLTFTLSASPLPAHHVEYMGDNVQLGTLPAR